MGEASIAGAIHRQSTPPLRVYFSAANAVIGGNILFVGLL
jgi:hypothetical protein